MKIYIILIKKSVCEFLVIIRISATSSRLRFSVLSTDHGERQRRVVLVQGCAVETYVLLGMGRSKIVCPRVLISGDVNPQERRNCCPVTTTKPKPASQDIPCSGVGTKSSRAYTCL